MPERSTYGAAFADVYDEWYGASDDLKVVVDFLASSQPRRVLELGVGTGRIAIPLAARLRATDESATVVGIDESPEMLALLATNDSGGLVHAVIGDMVDNQPDDSFDLVFVSYNTLFNVVERSRQQACITAAARRLSEGGLLVIDACVIDTSSAEASSSQSTHDASTQQHGSSTEQRGAWQVHTETTFDAASGAVTGSITSRHQDGRVTVRPFTITYSSPREIDAMCATAGLTLVSRHGSWQKTAFDDDSARHVSVYRNLR
ncbi:MAG: class I SAM-dependent methyltransferase [Ilumatobacteraceae bacterium]